MNGEVCMNECQLNKKCIREGIEKLNQELGANAIVWKDYAHIVGRKTVVTRLVIEAVDERMSRLVKYDFNMPRSGTRIKKQEYEASYAFDEVVSEYEQISTLNEQNDFQFIDEKELKLVELFSKGMYVNRIGFSKLSDIDVDGSKVLQSVEGGLHVYGKVNEFGETLIHDVHDVNCKDRDVSLEHPRLNCFMTKLKKCHGFRGVFIEAFIDEDSFTVVDVHYCVNKIYNETSIEERLKEFEARFGGIVIEYSGKIAMPVYQNEAGISACKDTVLSRKARSDFSAWNSSGDIGKFYCKLNAMEVNVIEFKDGWVMGEYEGREDLTFDFAYPATTSKSLRSNYNLTMSNKGKLIVF